MAVKHVDISEEITIGGIETLTVADTAALNDDDSFSNLLIVKVDKSPVLVYDIPSADVTKGVGYAVVLSAAQTAGFATSGTTYEIHGKLAGDDYALMAYGDLTNVVGGVADPDIDVATRKVYNITGADITDLSTLNAAGDIGQSQGDLCTIGTAEVVYFFNGTAWEIADATPGA